MAAAAGLRHDPVDAPADAGLGAGRRARRRWPGRWSTRPQTLAWALVDSPVGLLAWDLEWFVDDDPAEQTQTAIDPDAILAKVTITWLTGTAGSSARMYTEAGQAWESPLPVSGVPSRVC